MAILVAAQRAALESNPWFMALSAPVREAAIAAGRVQAYAPGAVLHRQGGPAEAWFGILAGAVKIRTYSQDGRESVLTFLEPGAWFGEISLLDGQPRTHDGIAYGPTRVLAVAQSDFRRLLDAYPELALHLLRLQCQRLRLLFAAIDDLSTKPLDARLARQLLSLAHTYGVEGAHGVRIGLRLPQEQIAQLVGASRQRVNAELAAWSRRGWVSVHYGEITLRDRDALRALAEPGKPAASEPPPVCAP